MWTAVRNETGGRGETQVFPQNNKHPGSDPAVLQMLVSGEIQFFTLMGGILGNVVPAANVQQVPFAFRSADHAHRTLDGPLGAYLREEMAAKGIVGFPTGAFDNGMRQVGGRTLPIRVRRI
jgi:TRAP-type C4-dicarboxylate transport system substrate-binding protein